MSYDLYFFKEKASLLTGSEVESYLSGNLVKEENNHWFFQNPDTAFENTESEEFDNPNAFENFIDLNLSFNLNFLRPSFFGLEAFEFIEKFIRDLDLYILNPQSDCEKPYQPTQSELFENWNKTNLSASLSHFSDQNSYLEIEKSNKIWNYNYNRVSIQQKLGNAYFVPKIFFFKTKENNEVITICSWTEHIPNVIPEADYFLLTQVKKRWFKTIKENALISREKLLSIFENHLDNHDFPDCKIIHPENAQKIKTIFNYVTSQINLETFAERIQIENLFNAK